MSKNKQIATVLLSFVLISSTVSFSDAFADGEVETCDGHNFLDFQGIAAVESITAIDPEKPNRITITFFVDIANPEEISKDGFTIKKSNGDKKVLAVIMGDAPNQIYVDVDTRVYDVHPSNKVTLSYRHDFDSDILVCDGEYIVRQFDAKRNDSGIFDVKYYNLIQHITKQILVCFRPPIELCFKDPQIIIQSKSQLPLDVLTIASDSLPNVTIGLGVNIIDNVDSKLSLKNNLNWYSDLQGFLGTGKGLTVNELELQKGLHTITANVTDSRGNYMEDTIKIHIRDIEDKKPSVYQIYPKYDNAIIIKDELTKRDVIKLRVVDDLDLYQHIKSKTIWSSDKDGFLHQGNTLNLLRADLSVDTHIITATSFDWGGNQVTDIITFNVLLD